MQGYTKYSYEGPVMIFDKIATDHWKGETSATSESKARANLAYQFKKQYNLAPNAKVSLPGEMR